MRSTSYRETAVYVTAGATYTIDCEVGNAFRIQLGASNLAVTFTNPPGTLQAFVFSVNTIQSTTARTITWPTTVRWSNGVAPILTSTAAASDVFTFITVDGGANWLGFISGQDLK
jgi:hypothetical protein